MSDEATRRLVEALLNDITQQRSTGTAAMDAMPPGEQPLVQMPQWGGMPQGVDPRSMMDVGPEQGLPGGVNPQDLLERLRRGY